jgi:hypothetical protein
MLIQNVKNSVFLELYLFLCEVGMRTVFFGLSFVFLKLLLIRIILPLLIFYNGII